MALRTQKATCTLGIDLSTSVIIPIVPLHMPSLINELFKNITRAPVEDEQLLEGLFLF